MMEHIKIMSNEVDFYIKKGDTSPPLKAQLKEDDGSTVDLTGANVSFRMRKVGSDTVKVDSSANIDNAVEGKVSYVWSKGDTDTQGYYNVVFGVDYDNSGNVDETFPNFQYITVKVDEQL